MGIFRKQCIETTYACLGLEIKYRACILCNTMDVCTNCNCVFICMPLSIIWHSHSQQHKAVKTIIQRQNQVKPCQHKWYTANQNKLNMKSSASREGKLGELTKSRSSRDIPNYYEKLHVKSIFAHPCFTSCSTGVYGRKPRQSMQTQKSYQSSHFGHDRSMPSRKRQMPLKQMPPSGLAHYLAASSEISKAGLVLLAHCQALRKKSKQPRSRSNIQPAKPLLPPPAVGACDIAPGISVLTQKLLYQTSLLSTATEVGFISVFLQGVM